MSTKIRSLIHPEGYECSIASLTSGEVVYPIGRSCLLAKELLDFSFENWQILNHYTPYDFVRNSVVAMNDSITGINNFAGV